MNSRILILTLVAALAAPAATRGAPSELPYACSLRSVACDSTPVQLGASQNDVARSLGLPHTQVNDRVWIYRGYHCTASALPASHGCTILVLTYADRRVVDMKLVNTAAARVITTASRTGGLVTYVPDEKSGLLAVDLTASRPPANP